jgi:transcription initiation factor TFIIH subunit 2
MADSDGDYVQEVSDNEMEAHQVTRGRGGGTRASGQKSRGGGWEVTRTWENVVESADGTINSTIEELLEAGKRKR